ncbi:hypothetical protein Ddye_004996 [Dipteronia dyeriana]|uniref:Reverse transcriptase n=1 Tax=Dipteronia dyeriana TaxID=168575 RepID=A0AAD9XG90_9ROSI|nr:hypothetical protein Ddye_004996 [Dipteronia dyeriana]
MSKAYDQVEWAFLKGMMHKMGFSKKWVNLVIDCVSMVTYSFKLNGEVMGNIIPPRGLRQGDPLSPYLFLICAEGLSSLIYEALVSIKISEFKCSQRGPIISHIFSLMTTFCSLRLMTKIAWRFARREVESTLHAMWDCQKLMYARRDWLPKNVMVRMNYANFYEFITDISTKIDNEALRFFCIICWRSWFLRNTLLHKNGSHMVGIGMVIHDSTGSVMASCCQILEANSASYVAEIMVIFIGILFSKDCGLNPYVLESDKGVAVEQVLNNNFLNASYGSILFEIAVLRIQAKVSNVRAIRPSANCVAQGLAKLALETKTNTFWMEDIPFCIMSIVEADMPS